MRIPFKTVACVLLLQCLLLSACESKFVETPPDDSDNGSSQSLEDRVSEKRNFENDLSHLSAIVSKTKRIAQLFQRFQKNADSSLYTELDLLSDITAELKKGIPDAQEGSYVGVAHVNLPISSLSPECQKVDAKLKSLGASVDDNTDRAIISVKTCETKGEYVETFVLSTKGSNIDSIQIKDGAIRALFPTLTASLTKAAQLCDFQKNEDRKIQEVVCQNLSLPINSVDTAVLDDLTYNASGDIRLSADGRILEKGKPDLSVSLQIDKNLIPREFNVAPIDTPKSGPVADQP